MPADPEPTQSPPSGATRGCDVLTIALLALATWWAVVGTPVTLFSVLRDVLSPLSVIYIAGSVQVVRHLMWPRPSATARLRILGAAIRERPHVPPALRAFFMPRPAVFVVAFASVITLGIT